MNKGKVRDNNPESHIQMVEICADHSISTNQNYTAGKREKKY